MLTFTDAEVRYGTRIALRASFHIASGESVALVGPSGAGKSTALGLATGSRPLHAGQVTVHGKKLATLNERQLQRVRAQIGTVRQHHDLVGPLAAIHNVGAGNLGRWSTGTALLSLLSPREKQRSLDAMHRLGIAHLAGHRTETLSGGEKQRVALARVLVQNPPLILADEPIASLDPERAREVIALLTSTAKSDGRTLVASLHDFDIARSAFDRVIGLREGRVLFDLPSSDVTDDHGRALYRIAA